MTTTNIDGAVAQLKIVAAKKGKKTPYAGKEARKSKLPIPPRPVAQQAASAARKPDVDDVPEFLKVENRVPLAPEQKSKVDAILAAAATPNVKQGELREKQKEAKKEKSRVRVEKLLAQKDGASAAMPLTGKAALRAIAEQAVKTVPITKVPADRSPGMARLRKSGQAEAIKAKTIAENEAATAAKPAQATAKARDASKEAKGSQTAPKAEKRASVPRKGTAKPFYKEDDGKRAVQMMRRQLGATSNEMQKELKWTGYIVRRFVRDVVRKSNKMGLRCVMTRDGGETRYKITN